MSHTPQKILAFAASNSRNSINKSLVAHAADVYVTQINPAATVEVLDLNDFERPIYSIDREMADGVPQAARDFLAKIAGADAILISYAEHNGLFTAAYKNIFDWSSRAEQKVFQGKPMVITSASPGSGGASNVLGLAVGSAPFFGADVKASFSVGPFSEKFDTQTGTLTDAELAATLRDALATLKESLQAAA